MPRIGVVSDIHGNLPAFNAVLHELRSESLDYIVCLGDIIGMGGFPSEVISAVQDSCAYSIAGNHDKLPFQGSPESTIEQIEKEVFFEETTEAQQSWLYQLPSMREIESGKVLLAHSEPASGRASGLQDGNSGVRPKSFTEIGGRVDNQIVLLGHTHTQHAVDLRDFGYETLVLNPGSVGGVYQEYAEYAIVDTDDFSYKLHRVSYDHVLLQEQIEEFEEAYSIDLWGERERSL